jgi:hypothetical protein
MVRPSPPVFPKRKPRLQNKTLSYFNSLYGEGFEGRTDNRPVTWWAWPGRCPHGGFWARSSGRADWPSSSSGSATATNIAKTVFSMIEGQQSSTGARKPHDEFRRDGPRRRRPPLLRLRAPSGSPACSPMATSSLTAKSAASRARGARPIDLGPTRLLEFFLAHPGRVFSREQLLDSVWGRDISISAVAACANCSIGAASKIRSAPCGRRLCSRRQVYEGGVARRRPRVDGNS